MVCMQSIGSFASKGYLSKLQSTHPPNALISEIGLIRLLMDD